MRKHLIACALAGALAVFGLAGCSDFGSVTFTDILGETYVELDGFSGETEGDFELAYTEGAIDVELEGGSVDIEIYDINRTWNDDGPDSITPLDVIFEAEGLTDGDHVTFSDNDGDIMVVIKSEESVTGKLTFTENEG